MTAPVPNPFAPAASIQEDLGVFGDAVLLRKGFLHRVIQFGESDADLSGDASLQENADLRGDLGGSGHPFEGGPVQDRSRFTLVYNGWWFVQRVHIAERLAWWAISWLTIRKSIEFKIPSKLLDQSMPSRANQAASNSGGSQPSGINPSRDIKIEIDFGRGLKIRRFRVWLDREIRYDEIC